MSLLLLFTPSLAPPQAVALGAVRPVRVSRVTDRYRSTRVRPQILTPRPDIPAPATTALPHPIARPVRPPRPDPRMRPTRSGRLWSAPAAPLPPAPSVVQRRGALTPERTVPPAVPFERLRNQRPRLRGPSILPDVPPAGTGRLRPIRGPLRPARVPRPDARHGLLGGPQFLLGTTIALFPSSGPGVVLGDCTWTARFLGDVIHTARLLGEVTSTVAILGDLTHATRHAGDLTYKSKE